ncbi:MAG: hypothetical protein KVP17_003175 [Porospora cf. gigantea B]|nr:MAG: hypothetical protein KVP17_003175 [Porospora cf. gigantea B]
MFVAVGVSFVLEMGSYYWATAVSTAGAAAIVVVKEFLSSLVNQAAYIGVLILMSRLSSQHLPSFSFNVFVSIENFGEWIQGFLNAVIIKRMDIGPDFSKLPALHCICQGSRLIPLLVLLATGSRFWSYIAEEGSSKGETDIEAEMTSNPLSSLSACESRSSYESSMY